MCRVRMHYGHPDVFDRVFHLTRGGFSKASKIINISEDIYAGLDYNNMNDFLKQQLIWYQMQTWKETRCILLLSIWCNLPFSLIGLLKPF